MSDTGNKNPKKNTRISEELDRNTSGAELDDAKTQQGLTLESQSELRQSVFTEIDDDEFEFNHNDEQEKSEFIQEPQSEFLDREISEEYDELTTGVAAEHDLDSIDNSQRELNVDHRLVGNEDAERNMQAQTHLESESAFNRILAGQVASDFSINNISSASKETFSSLGNLALDQINSEHLLNENIESTEQDKPDNVQDTDNTQETLSILETVSSDVSSSNVFNLINESSTELEHEEQNLTNDSSFGGLAGISNEESESTSSFSSYHPEFFEEAESELHEESVSEQNNDKSSDEYLVEESDVSNSEEPNSDSNDGQSLEEHMELFEHVLETEDDVDSSNDDQDSASSNSSVGAISDTNTDASTISESVSNGASVGITASATDGDVSDTVSYSLSDDAGGRFSIDATSGVVSVADASLLDYESASAHTIEVTATSSDGSTSTQSYTIHLTDDTSEAAVGAISDTNTDASTISESVSNGASVGITASATDGDVSDTVSYSLSDDAGGRFSIDATSGVVSVADASLLDYESASAHTIEVTATSSDGSTSTQSYTIHLTDDTSEAAVGAISDTNTDASTISESVSNGASVGITASATDGDVSDTVSYSLSDDAGGRFSIDATSGVVSVADASLLDYESASAHTIEVTATSSDGSTSTQSYTIHLTDDTSEAAVGAISDTNTDASTISESVSNGASVGITASATDGDVSDTVSYSLSDDAGGRFSIDATSGVVSVADASLLDYESASAHTIEVTATSSDGSTSTQSYTIHLTDDTSEAGVGAISDTNTDASTISESVSNGASVGITASATDGDVSDTVSYSLSDDAGGRFSIDATSGVVSVADASLLDYESASAHTIEVTATSSDGSTSTQSYTIHLTDDTSEAGVGAISDTNTDASTISESVSNGASVGITASATDGDVSDTVSYSLSDDAGGRFSIDATSGVVSVADASLLDYESASAHTIEVTATSSDGSTSTQSYTIHLTDDTSEAGVGAISDTNTDASTISESVSNGASVGITASATDGDVSDTVSYSLSDDAGGRFSIDATSGVVSVADASLLDYESASAHTIEVTATSSDGSTSTQSYTIHLTDDTSEAAVGAISDTNTDASTISESVSNGASVGITASATDGDVSDTVSYSLSDDAGGRFSIDATSGVVSVADASLLDYESASAHTIEVTATSSDGSTSTQSYTIHLTDDTSEAAVGAISDTNTDASTISESVSNGASVGITASATDGDVSDTVSYSLSDDAGGRFSIDATSGVVSVADASLLDYESASAHTIEVTATSSDGSTSTQSYTIHLTDEIDSNPTDLEFSANADLNSVTSGTVVGQISSVIDADSGDAHTYSLVNDAGGLFNIDSNTGDISLSADAVSGNSFSAETGSDNPFNGIDVGTESPSSFADIDGDGDLDMVIGESNGNINYYENTGSSTNSTYTAQTGSNNPFNSIDVGSYSTPTLADVDGDGDIDMIVGEANGNINYYENTGSSTNPTYTIQTGSDNPFNSVDVGDYSTPTLADIDGDGDLDMVVGESNGNINYYENTGSSTNPTYTAQTGSDNPFNSVDVGDYSAPTLADIDGDGDLDMVVGESNGNINYYENTGSSTNPTYTAQTGSNNPFDGVDVGDYSTPTLADIDGDGDMDLVVGEENGNLNYFENESVTTSGGSITVEVTDSAGNTYQEDLNIELGNNGANSLNGSAGNDIVYGLDGNDTIDSSDGDDIIIGGVGDDTIDGGSDTDTVVYTGSRSDYSIVQEGSSIRITDLRSGTSDGSDLISNVERFQFDDGTIELADITFDVVNNNVSAISNSAGSAQPGIELINENFNSGVSGWGSQVSSNNNRMLIEYDETATKTFDFGSEHANQTVIIEFDLFGSQTDAGGWESSGSLQDYFQVTANGTQIVNDSFGDGTSAINHHYSLEVTTDSNGQVNLALQFDGTYDYEIAEIDNFTITSGSDWIDDNGSVSEDANNGDAVGITASATDSDVSDSVTYSLSNDANGRFTINSSTGVVSVADASLLDYETATSHDIEITATSTDGSTSTQSYTINLTDVYELPDAPDSPSTTNTINDPAGGGGDGDGDGDGGGDSDILGTSANDLIYANDGNDKVDGAGGGDIIYGGEGNDTLYGHQLSSGGDGDGGGGSDDAATDYLYGEAGNDYLYGGEGNDYLDGGSGIDRLYGEAGDDYLVGGSGNDYLYGGSGNDFLNGGSGNDDLYGGDGNDVFLVGSGVDDVWGEAGDDTFIFREGDGTDNDFDGGSGWTDVIRLQNSSGGDPTTGWTYQLDSGSVESTGDGYIDLSSDASGSITLADGSELDFTNLERIEW